MQLADLKPGVKFYLSPSDMVRWMVTDKEHPERDWTLCVTDSGETDYKSNGLRVYADIDADLARV